MGHEIDPGQPAVEIPGGCVDLALKVIERQIHAGDTLEASVDQDGHDQ